MDRQIALSKLKQCREENKKLREELAKLKKLKRKNEAPRKG